MNKVKMKKPIKKTSSKRSVSKKSNLLSRINFLQPRALAVIVLVTITGVSLVYFALAGSPTVVVREDFAASAQNFTTVAGGKWNVVDGKYALTSPSSTSTAQIGNANYAVHNYSLTGDFVVEADYTVAPTQTYYNDAAMIFGWQDPANYLYAAYNEKADPNTNGIFLIKNGVQTRLVEFDRTFAAGQARHAKIERVGDVISAFDGMTKVGSVSTAEFKTGRFGIGSRNDTVTFDNFVLSTSAADSVPPTVPANLTSNSVTQTTATVTWSASSDNAGVASYVVYRSGTRIATVATPSYTLTNLSAGSQYGVTVAATDAVGNTSAQSERVTFTTLASVPSSTPAPVATPATTLPPISQPTTGTKSWGPNGTNWPSRTPRPRDRVTVVEVDANWGAISDAIKAASLATVNQGLIIKVRPGSLKGITASGANPNDAVLKNVGSASWSKRILVYPRDGFGSVSMSGGTMFWNMQNVVIGGMKADSVKCIGCNKSGFAHFTYSGSFFVYGNAAFKTFDDFQMVEFAKLNAEKQNSDSMDFYTNTTPITNIRMAGFWIAPRYKEAASSAHTDTLQFEPIGGGEVSGVVENFAMFGSTNAAFQINGVDGMTFQNGIVYGGDSLGQSYGTSFYPLPSGASIGYATTFNGSGENVSMKDVIVVGPVRTDPGTFKSVINTRVRGKSAPKPASGAWTLDSSLSSYNPAPPARPTEASLKAMWARF